MASQVAGKRDSADIIFTYLRDHATLDGIVRDSGAGSIIAYAGDVRIHRSTRPEAAPEQQQDIPYGVWHVRDRGYGSLGHRRGS